jgi:hypothetical protein
MKKFFKKYGMQLAFVAVVIAAAAIFDPSIALASLLATTSTAQLGNGTIIQISVGSPTGFITIGNARDVKFLDGTSQEVDVTNLTSTWKEKRLGLPDGGTVTFKVDTDFGDPGQAACLVAKNSRTICDFKIILPAGTTPNVTFLGYVKKFNAGTSVDNPVQSDVEFLVTGPVSMA